MVVAPQPEAVEAGAEALRAGGNAVDAAVACALVQGVVDPLMTGIAGFGSLHLYLPDRGVHTFIDFHGRAPAATRPDMWAHLMEGETRDGFGFVLAGRVNDVGYQSITVPGSLRAYWEAQTEFGRLGWKDVVQPAIGVRGGRLRGAAARPPVLDPARAVRSRRQRRAAAPHPGRAAHLLRPRRRAPRARAPRMTNPDLGRTLRRIAEGGADVFYTGDMAREIAADMASHGGLLTLGGSRHLSHRADRAAVGRVPRPSRRHQPAAGGRCHAAGDAQHSGVLRPARPRPQQPRVHPGGQRGHDARHHRQGSPRGRPGLRRRAPRPPHRQGLRRASWPTPSRAASAPAWSASARARPPTPPTSRRSTPTATPWP